MKVLGPVRLREELRAQRIAAVVGIGDNGSPARLADYARGLGVPLVNAIHPSATVAGDVVLGTDVMIAGGAVVNPGSVLEDDVVVNTGATVDHDCVLDKEVFIALGRHLAGNVCLGEGAFLGTGVVPVRGVRTGRFTTVGAAGAVRGNMPNDVLARAHPAQVIVREGLKAVARGAGNWAKRKAPEMEGGIP